MDGKKDFGQFVESLPENLKEAAIELTVRLVDWIYDIEYVGDLKEAIDIIDDKFTFFGTGYNGREIRKQIGIDDIPQVLTDLQEKVLTSKD